MRIKRTVALVLAAFLALGMVAALSSAVNADDGNGNGDEGWPVEPRIEGVWYKFETPLVTLLFPSGGKKPVFIWWYTNDSSEVYVVKFKGVMEYLSFDAPHYLRRYNADDLTIMERLRTRFIEPKMNQLQQHLRARIQNRLAYLQQWMAAEFGLHRPYLPFSACSWELDEPALVVNEEVSYWAFNFTLKDVRIGAFDFAEDNIQIRCRFYNTSATEIIDDDHNYTVAAGQLKFDFIVKNWEWNLDKIKPFFEELVDEYAIEIPPNKTGLALWMNLASIEIEDLDYVENELQNQEQNLVEARSQMAGAMIRDQYYGVSENETALGDDEKPIPLLERLRERARIRFARREGTMAGFLEFVPWARLLNETGDTVRYVNVTASYIAAGGHMRLFLCYPYFGNNTLEHDPTLGLASALLPPTLVTPELLGALLIATGAIVTAVAIVKWKKKTINVVGVR